MFCLMISFILLFKCAFGVLFRLFAGILRYKVDFQSMQLEDDDNFDYDYDEY